MNPKNSHSTVTEILQYNASLKLPKRKGRIKEIEPIQYCTGSWNVRSVNQGKLQVVKYEMARVNIDILGISELKWTGLGEFKSDDHYIYYYGQDSEEME